MLIFKPITCCAQGHKFLRLLDNDQHADPGYLHVRMFSTLPDTPIEALVRVRFCPWCGDEFLDDSDKLPVESVLALLAVNAPRRKVETRAMHIKRMCSHKHSSGNDATRGVPVSGERFCETCGATFD